MESWKINHLKNVYLENEDIPEGEVKVRVSKALLDTTDLNLLKGDGNRYPIIPSHIAIGNVSEEYEDLGLKFGVKVLISPYEGTDKAADKNVYIAPDIDTMGVDMDGFLRDYVAVDRDNLFLLPDTVEDKDALFVEDIALGVKIFSELDIDKGETVVIIGGSALGIILCQLAIYYQAVPILIDSDSARLSIATEMGVYYAINPQESEVLGQILSFTSGRMADYVIYDPTTNTPLQPALQYSRRGGKIAIAGHNKANVSIELSKLLEKQLQLIGINNGYGEIATAINLVATGSINTKFIQTDDINFDEVDKKLTSYLELPETDLNIVVSLN